MKLILGSLLAAAAVFFWGFLSWTVLGWHENGMHGFQDEAAVAEVIKKNVDSGHAIYLLPWKEQGWKTETIEDRKTREEKFNKAVTDGPFVYAVVRPGKGEFKMSRNMILGVIRSFVAALILGALLSQTHLPYAGRIAFAAAAGLFAGLVTDMPMWIWFGLPGRDLFVSLADHVIEWTIGGVVLGLFAGRDPTAAHEHI